MALDLKSLQNIKLTKQQQNNLAAAVIIIGFGLFAYVKWWFIPMTNKVKEKTAVLEQKKKDLKDARQMVMKYSEFVRRSNEIINKVDFMNRRLPKGTNISDTIRELSKSATEANISIINFKPDKEKNMSSYKELNIKLVFDANFRDLGNFLTRIGYIERLTVPSAFRIKKLEGEDATERANINVEMMVKIFSFNE